MRIAQIAPIVESVPPKKYGGTERIVSALSEGLVKNGHNVTLFASGDSMTSAKLISVYPKSLREARFKDLYGINIFTMLNIGVAYQMQDQFDIIHDHTGYASLPAANISRTPVLMTLHGALSIENNKIYKTLNRVHYATISKAQGRSFPNLNYAGTVYNGLNMKHYPFSDTDEGYLLFVGRISIQKGVHYAIEVAHELDLPLVIAAKLDDTDKRYFYEFIEPHLSSRIKWVGEVDEEERNKLMSKALAFLHPVTWKEPFGLTLIESQACGCPVVAFRKGSIPEVVKNGKTGYVVEDTDEMIESVLKIKNINRKYCRDYVLKKFNATRMVKEYEKIYRRIIKESELTYTENNNKYQKRASYL